MTPAADSPAANPAKPSEQTVPMPRLVLFAAVVYLVCLGALFSAYVTSPTMRSSLPRQLGDLPMGVVWFGSVGAVTSSLYGIFIHNRDWKASYDYWHYCRPLVGAVTGSIGALFYLALLRLGSTTAVAVDSVTFYSVAFVLGFADRSFISMLGNVVAVVVKPGNKQ